MNSTIKLNSSLKSEIEKAGVDPDFFSSRTLDILKKKKLNTDEKKYYKVLFDLFEIDLE
jgi:hypothetical protein